VVPVFFAQQRKPGNGAAAALNSVFQFMFQFMACCTGQWVAR
jgi:hypothetical protein